MWSHDCHTHLLSEAGSAAASAGGCGLLNVQDIELCQLSMVTETGEGGPPKHVARNIGSCVYNRECKKCLQQRKSDCI